MEFDQENLSGIVHRMQGRRIAVVGDVMLDRFVRGSVRRISPEAPVPVLNVEDETEHPGGAANVGYNLVTLGCQPLLLGVVGQDTAGARLRGLLDELGIGGSGLVADPGRQTTTKGRVVAGGQHIVRIDRESQADVSEQALAELIARLESQIATLDAVILQDYNKGVITATLIQRAIAVARAHNVPVYVDPKHANFFGYSGVDVFKPNRKEAEDALGYELKTPEARRKGAEELLERLRCRYVVLTLGSEGMMVAQAGADPVLAATKAMQVADVSGAGDTVIAALAASCAAGATMYQAVAVANHAAGIVCGKSGTAPVYSHELLQDLQGQLLNHG